MSDRFKVNDRITHEVLLGVAFAIAGLLVRLALDPLLGNLQPFAPGFVIVVLAGFVAGWRCATIAGTLNYLGAVFYFVEPRGEWSFSAQYSYTSLAVNIVSYAAVIYVGHRARVAAQGLESANGALAESLRSKDQFLAQMGHELRNPLNVVLHGCALLRRTMQSEQIVPVVERVERQARVANRIVEDLVDLERIKAGRLSLSPVQCDLRVCVQEAVERLEDALDRHSQELDVRMPDAAVLVHADPARCSQIFGNLIENAIKYAGKGAHVTVTLSVEGNEAVVEVRDDGEGVRPEQLPRLLDGSAKAAGEAKGLGLGMPLCHQLVIRQGGRMELRSQPGQGFAAVVSFPIVKSQGASPAGAALSQAA